MKQNLFIYTLGLSLVLLGGCTSTGHVTGNLKAASSQNSATPVFAPPYSDVLTGLRTNPKTSKAMALLPTYRADNNSILVELNEIPAPPFGEEKRAERFVQMLKTAGLNDVTIDDTGNVIGRRPGKTGQRTLAIAAHLDTVFPHETDVTVKIEGDTFIAPGIGDNTRGLVVLLSVLRALEEAGIETQDDVLFIGNVGEEGLGDLRGTKALFAEGGPNIDAFIAIDGGAIDRLIYGGVGSHRYRVTVNGPGGHSWGNFGDANPHHALGRAIALFSERAPEVSSEGPKTSFNVGRIGGGTSINSIPFESWMEVDMRSGDQSKLDDMDEIFQSAMQDGIDAENSARKSGPALTLDIKKVGKRPAGKGDPDSALIQQTMAAMNALGVKPALRISSTDSNIPISLGIPAVTLSRGGISKGAHSAKETWTDRDSHVAEQLLLLTVLQQAGVERP